QLLARLDGRPLHNAARTAEAQLRDARSRLAQLERDDARVTRLLDSRAANAEEAEKVRAGRESAAAAVDAAAAQSAEAGRMVTETRLIAPFDGTVTAVLMEPGEFAQPGLPVVAISGEDRLEVEIEVPESVRARLRVAAAVTVALPLAGLDSLTGTVKSIGRAGLGPGRLFPVIVALDPARPGDAGEVDAEPALVPGLTAQVTIATGTTAMTVVPVAAVVDPGGQAPAVYRVVAGRAERISVEVGALVGDAIAVRGGLTADDVVVIDGHASLIHGERVEVQP
ncbi:MAG: efflux RND transporter periplasmic adaptor subunit, partial [Myxococcota bacterium]